MKSLWIMGILCAGVAVSAGAQSKALDGRAVIQRVYDRDDGRDSYAKVEMLLTDRTGLTQARSMVWYTKDFGPRTKTYMRFTSPASIDGTAFLSWEVEGKDDEQFLFLPELGRDRRIVSSQKNGDFVNTDFTFEDMQRRHPSKDTQEILRMEKRGGYDCYVVKSVPVDPKSSQYRSIIAWVPKGIDLPLRVEFYTRVVRQPTKVLMVNQLKKIDGIWTAMETEMRNEERNTRTIIRTLDVKYNKGVPDRFFSRAHLKSGR